MLKYIAVFRKSSKNSCFWFLLEKRETKVRLKFYYYNTLKVNFLSSF